MAVLQKFGTDVPNFLGKFGEIPQMWKFGEMTTTSQSGEIGGNSPDLNLKFEEINTAIRKGFPQHLRSGVSENIVSRALCILLCDIISHQSSVGWIKLKSITKLSWLKVKSNAKVQHQIPNLPSQKQVLKTKTS